MIIWPETVSRTDESWNNARALMRVLPLDVRLKADKATTHGSPVCLSVDELLIRPMITVDERRVPAPHYCYRLDFSVSCSVIGTIPIDDEAQLQEFLSVVNEAAGSELTQAESRAWEAYKKCAWMQRTVLAERPGTHHILHEEIALSLATSAELRRTAHQFYNAHMNSMLDEWRANGALGQRPDHNDVLFALVAHGKELIAEEDGEATDDSDRPRECSPG